MDLKSDVVHSGYFLKEGSWVRSWKRRYFEILRSGFIIYRESKDAVYRLGEFDISGRLECEKGVFSNGNNTVGLIIHST